MKRPLFIAAPITPTPEAGTGIMSCVIDPWIASARASF